MELIEIKIPKDDAVIKATASWLLGLVSGETTVRNQKEIETPVISGHVTAANYQLPQYWINPVDLACGVLENHGAMTEYLECANSDDGYNTELVSYHDYKAFKEKLDGAQRHESKQTESSNTESAQDTVKGVAPSADVELDVNGLPWDARIHAKTQTKNKDGSWRYKKGVDHANLVPEVEAELKQAVAANQSAGDIDPEKERRVEQLAIENGIKAPPPPPQTTQQAAPPPPVTTDLKPVEELTLADAVAEVAGYKTKQLLTDKQADELAQVHGLNQFMLLATAPNLIAKVMTDVRQAVN